MGRPRKTGHNLPKRVSLKRGAYYYIDRANKWHRLAGEDELGAALAKYRELAVEDARDPIFLDQVLEKFLHEHCAPLKPKTLAMYTRCVDIIKPAGAEFKPGELTAIDVNRLVRAVESRHGAATAVQVRATLSAMYSY
jgi:hypothetical protein